MLTITTAASDPTLLTLEEIKSAVGVTDASQNTALTALNARVASALAQSCGILAGGISSPTFRVETITETFRDEAGARYLRMARRPIVSVASIVLDGTTLDATTYEIDARMGRIYRLLDDASSYWSGTKATVLYDAGWATVPSDLKLAASKLARMLWSEDGPDARSDPNLKRHRVEGVGEREYWVAPASDPLMSGEIRELLAPYREMIV